MNVLRGEMSVVGPRPPLLRETEAYDDQIRRRLLVKPGLTGLWQTSGRSDLPWDETVRLDLLYVENWSLVQDLLIVVKTVRTVIRGRRCVLSENELARTSLAPRSHATTLRFCIRHLSVRDTAEGNFTRCEHS